MLAKAGKSGAVQRKSEGEAGKGGEGHTGEWRAATGMGWANWAWEVGAIGGTAPVCILSYPPSWA